MNQLYIPSLTEDNSVILKCFTTVNKSFIRCLGIYDTGCQRTTFIANALGARLDDVVTSRKHEVRGIYGDRGGVSYDFHLAELVIGNIYLGPQDIRVSFDPALTVNLIGYDILKQINRASIANSSQEMLFKTEAELRAYFGNTSGILRALRFPQAKELREYLLSFLTTASAEALGLTTDDEKLAYVIQTLNM